MPGRKAIVLFSDGIEFPLAQLTPKLGPHADPEFISRMEARMKEIADLANRNGVVFYTFDAKRLQTPVTAPDPRRRASMQTVSYFLAKETGGLFVHDTEALSDALGKAMEDMSGYYLLGYTPTPAEFDGKRGDDLNHRIRVKVRRSGLNVRTRTGFSLPPETIAAGPESRQDLMRRALFSPFAAGTIGMRLSPVYSASPPDPKTGARRSLLRAMVAIDGRDVRLVPANGGKKSVVLDIAAVVFDANNKVVAGKDQRYAMELPEPQAAGLAGSSLNYQMDIPIPKPGPYQIRAAVRDDGGNAADSAGAFVEIPDFNKPALVLSSLVLSSPVLSSPVLSEAEGGDNGSADDLRIAARGFKIGQRISYAFQIFGARSGRPGGTPKLEVELRLFRDGVQVFGGKPIPITPEPGEKETTVLGSFVVPPGFVEGEYTVQVIAHDRLADSKTDSKTDSRKGSASQWAGLTLSR